MRRDPPPRRGAGDSRPGEGRKDPHRPEAMADVLQSFLKERGLEDRVEQAAVIPEWPQLVGETIAQQTEPLHVSADGTLVVAVRTHAWMTELQLMTPQLLRRLNQDANRPPVRKIRFRLMDPAPRPRNP